MTDEEFRSCVEDGIASLPAWVQSQLTNLIFLIEDEPHDAHKREHALGDGDTLFGLYEGIPLTERGNESPSLPDIITLFKKPILETYTNPREIRECIENTVWHEVAHYFGHDEDWVRDEEIRRGKTL